MVQTYHPLPTETQMREGCQEPERAAAAAACRLWSMCRGYIGWPSTVHPYRLILRMATRLAAACGGGCRTHGMVLPAENVKLVEQRCRITLMCVYTVYDFSLVLLLRVLLRAPRFVLVALHRAEKRTTHADTGDVSWLKNPTAATWFSR